MQSTAAHQEVAVQTVEHQSIEMELLSQYGTSGFVDAIEASRFDRAFQKRLKVGLVDDPFWDDVRTKLRGSASAKL